jgi:hypothetical protein
MTTSDILAEHPELTGEDVHESLLYATRPRRCGSDSRSCRCGTPREAESLKAAGHDAVHVRDLSPQAATDEVVLEHARSQG